ISRVRGTGVGGTGLALRVSRAARQENEAAQQHKEPMGFQLRAPLQNGRSHYIPGGWMPALCPPRRYHIRHGCWPHPPDCNMDTTGMTIEQQLDFLFEGSYFADEASLKPGQDSGESGIRAQMRGEMKKKLERSARTGEPLRIYIGADPTRTSLHIGHMVPVVKLRRFQQLGHQVIFLIGDYTAMIGDPTGQSSERKRLTHEDVMEMAKFYTGQAHRLLDPDRTEIRFNGEWLGRLSFAETTEIAAQFPLSQIIARQDFRDRPDSGAGVRLHECFYSLMQGYDAFALNCDVQVGGYDQHFNLLAGRILQKYFAERHHPDSGNILAGHPHPLAAEQPQTGTAVKGP